jgi:hypothetical protein
VKVRDEQRYEQYVAFCQRLGIEPLSEERWRVTSESSMSNPASRRK